MAEQFLDTVYDVRNADETRALYDAWAKTYEAEVAVNGYVTPRRCAVALASCMPNKSVPILDFGCGTGLSGLALRNAGFTKLDGIDLSAEMLEEARAKGAYQSLFHIDADVPLPVHAGAYEAVAAIGVIGAGAAPISMFDTLMGLLVPGGLFVFSFNDHTLADPVHEDRVARALKDQEAVVRVREYGPHLTKLNLNSVIYIIEKL